MKKQIISLICAFALVVSLFAGMGIGLATRVNASGSESWTSYNAAEGFNMDTAKTAAEISERFSYNSAADSYTVHSAGWQDYKVSYLYTGKTYGNFVLEFDAKLVEPVGQDAWLWLEFGVADPAASFNTNAATGAVLTRIENNRGATPAINRTWGGGYTEAWGSQYDAYDFSAVHHIVLTVNEGKFSLKIDEHLFVNEWAITGYQGGYIGIGTGNNDTVLSGLQITDLDTPEPAETGSMDILLVPEGFSFDKAKQTAADNTCFTYNADTKTYNRELGPDGWQDYNVAYLYTKETYQDFKLEFDVKLCPPVGQHAWLWLEFGVADPAASFNTNAATGAVLTRIENNMETTAIVNRNWGGGYTEGWGAQYDAYNKDNTQHVVLDVKDGKYTLKINDFVLVNEWAITGYQGGYIGIGTGNKPTLISNITVTPYVVDKTGLEALVNANKDKVESDYTEESWTPFATAMTKAEAILAKADATEQEVADAVAALTAAVAGLEGKAVPVDKTGLEALVNANKDKVESYYTAESWATFASALTNAKAILNKEDATAQEVADATAALQTAAAGLVTATTESKLQCWWGREWYNMDSSRVSAGIGECYTYDPETDTFVRDINEGWQDFNVAYLYTKKAYQDFKLEFDVKLCPPENQDAWLWLEFGIEDPSASFNTNKEQGAVLTRIENNRGTTAIVNRNWGGGYTEAWGTQYDAYDLNHTYHVTLKVEDGKYWLSMDNVVLVDGWTLEGYDGGLIGIGTGNKPTTISNITVTNLDAPAQTGDSSSLMLIAAAMVFAVTGMTALLVSGKKYLH